MRGTFHLLDQARFQHERPLHIPIMIEQEHQDLKFILVGDHLGQVKRVLQPSNEISLLTGLSTPASSNPIVSIEPITWEKDERLIASKSGQLYRYDCIRNELEEYVEVDGSLIRAIPNDNGKIFLTYDDHVMLNDGKKNDLFLRQKRGQIVSTKLDTDGKIFASVGKDIPLMIHDIESKKKIYQADLPERDWLGIQPDCYVSELDFVGTHRIATCSKSDSTIRIYDYKRLAKKPAISINIDQTAFNEHADSARFLSVTSTGQSGHTIAVGSNVGQILAIDLRFNVKEQPKKRKMQPRSWKVLGGFKGPRGASIKDLKLIPDTQSDNGHLLISCCLDRYLRIHNLNNRSRELVRHAYMVTKPLCCSPVFYQV